MNKIILLGNLTRDPEISYGAKDDTIAIVKFSIAVNRPFVRDGEPNVDFFNCTAFGKKAEVIDKYVTKGSKISIVGTMHQNNYTAKDKSKVYGFNVIVEEIHFCDRVSKDEKSANGEIPV